MNKKALIKVVGKQRYGKESDTIDLTTVGTFEETNRSFILRYNEEQEPPLEAVKTTLNVSKDEKTVQLMREGKNGSLLIIERSKRNLCNYPTDFGDILMGIYGKNIEIANKEGSGKICFEYDIDINGAISSQNEVEITYKLN